MKRALVLREGDNVANALDDICAGESFVASCGKDGRTLAASTEIKFGFKVACEKIPLGGDIIKYGCVIGKASADIGVGECVHIHNVEGARGRGDREEK